MARAADHAPQRQDFSEAPGGGQLIVKRTFLEVVEREGGCGEDFAGRIGLRQRACSDPTLYELAKQEPRPPQPGAASAGSRGGGGGGGEWQVGEVAFEMSGLSDAETDPEDSGPSRLPLPCYDHVREHGDEPGSTASAQSITASEPEREAEGSEGCFSRQEAPSGGGARAGAGASGAGPAGVEGHAAEEELSRLVSENNRLALENRLLRENMRLAMENKLLVQGAAAAALEPKASPAGEAWDLALAIPAVAWGEQGSCTGAEGSLSAVPPQYQCAAAWWGRVGFPGPAAAEQQPGQPPLRRREKRAAARGTPAQEGGPGQAEADRAAASAAAADERRGETPPGERTTVMLRNLPNNYSRAMVLAMLDGENFGGLYDFLYLPIDFKSRACLGYAFVNLVRPDVVPAFWSTFNGYSKWVLPSKKICGVSWSGPQQGLDAHVERWRNSPVMHPTVPEEYHPVMFVGGLRVVFPAPTKAPRRPRVRNLTDSKTHWRSAPEEALIGLR